MRVIAGVLKNIQAGYWENLNTNVPSGAASDATNVDFPSGGGVRKRAGFKVVRDSTVFNVGANVQPVYASGLGYLTIGKMGGEYRGPILLDGVDNSFMGNATLPEPRQLLPVGQDVLMLAKSETLRVTGSQRNVGEVGFIEVLAGSANTTYTAVVQGTFGRVSASHTTPPAYNAGLNLSIDNVPIYSNEQTVERGLTRTGKAGWIPAKEGPQYLTRYDLPNQATLNQFVNASGSKGQIFLAGTGWQPGQHLDNSAIAGSTQWNASWGSSYPNMWHPLILASGSVPQHDWIEWDYRYVRKHLNPEYQARISEATFNYQKAQTEYQLRVAEQTTRSYIAQRLAAQIPGARVFGAIIEVPGATSIAVSDGASGADLRATLKEVSAVTNLPGKATDGTVMLVAGVPFEFTGGIWKERPGGTLSFSQTGLRWLIAKRPPGSAPKANGLDWVAPKAGSWDELSRMVGEHTPVYADIFGGRMVLLTSRGAFVSAVGNPLDVAPSSALSPTADDGYFLELGSGTDPVKAGLLWGSQLLAITSRRAFLVGLGSRDQTSITQLDMEGVGRANVFLARTSRGPVMLAQEGLGTPIRLRLLQPSPEGGRLVSVPLCPQFDEKKVRNVVLYMTSSASGDDLCIWHGAGHARLIDLRGEFPVIRDYKELPDTGWCGYVGDDLWLLYDKFCKQADGEARDFFGPIKATIEFHTPPQSGVYMPDNRHTTKAWTAWLQDGEMTLSAAGFSRTYNQPGEYHSLPIHLPGEHRLRVTSGAAPMYIREVQYKLVSRNGKTPSSWS